MHLKHLPISSLALFCALFAIWITPVCSQASSDLALLASFPTCATQCFVKIVPTTGCSVTDFDCLCAHPTFGDESIACFTAGCSSKDTLTATNISTTLCDYPVRDDSLTIEVTIIVLSSVALLFIILRVVARNPFKGELFGWDDGLIVAAFILTVPIVPTQILLVKHGIGRDIWKVPFNSITEFLKLFYLCEIWYIFGVNVMKMSILFFYLRVFPKSRTTRAAKITLWVVGVYGFAFLVMILFQCWPLSYIWTRWTGETTGKCVPLDLLWVHAALNIVLDLWVLLLPLPKLGKLQMSYSSHKKARVLAMFSVGIFVTFTSIMRMRTLAKMSYSRPNFTWDWTDCALWSGIEANTGIICACLPAVRALFAKTLPGWLQSTKQQSTRGKSYGYDSSGGMRPSGHSIPGGRSTPVAVGAGTKREEFVQLSDVQSTKSGSEVELTTNEVAPDMGGRDRGRVERGSWGLHR